MAEHSGGQVGDDPALAAKALRTLPVQKDLRRIADKCGNNWKELLVFVGLQLSEIQGFLVDASTSSDAVFQGLVFWRGGNVDDSDPVNWSTLLTAMEGAGMARDAGEWRQKIIERYAASLDRPRDAGQSGNDKRQTPGQEEPRSNVPQSATSKAPGPLLNTPSQPTSPKPVTTPPETPKPVATPPDPLPSIYVQCPAGPTAPRTGMDEKIGCSGDIHRVPEYRKGLIGEMRSLGSVLGIGEATDAIFNTNGSVDNHLLKILDHYIAVKIPTWQDFCKALKKLECFNSVRAKIEADHIPVTTPPDPQPTPPDVGELLRKYKDRIYSEVMSTIVSLRLQMEEVISGEVAREIKDKGDKKGNCLIYLHLMEQGDLKSLQTFATVLAEEDGNAKMQRLGKDLLAEITLPHGCP